MKELAYIRTSTECRERLRRVLEDPTEETWDDAYCIVVGPGCFGMTLWQVVIELDPSFPRVGPTSTLRRGRDVKVEGWRRIPDRKLLESAIRFATH